MPPDSGVVVKGAMVEPAASRVRWLLIGWLFVISAIADLDRVNISIAGPAILKEFGLTNIQLGWVFSAFVVCYAPFQAPGGWLADRLGPRLVLALGVLWWGIVIGLTTLLSADITGVLVLLIGMRFRLGMGEAVVLGWTTSFWVAAGLCAFGAISMDHNTPIGI